METVTGAGRWPAALKPEEAEGAASSFAKLLSSPDTHQPPGIGKPLPCRAGRGKDAMAESMAAASADGGSSPSNAGRIGADGWLETAGSSSAIQQDAPPSVDDEAERNRRDWFSGRSEKENRLKSGPHIRAALGEFPPPVWLPPLPQRLSQYHRHGGGGTTRAAAPESRSSARAETSVPADFQPRTRVEPSRSSSSKTAMSSMSVGGRAAAPSQSPVAAMASRQTPAPPLSDAASLETGPERREAGRSPSAAAIRSSPAPAWSEARREDSLPAAAALFPPADGKAAAASPSPAAVVVMAAGAPADAPTGVARHAGHVSGQGAPGAAGSANAGVQREPAVPALDNSSRIKLASASTGLVSPGAAANPLSGLPGRSRKQYEDAAAVAAAGRQDALSPPQPMAASDGASAPRPRNWTDGTPQSLPQSEPEQSSGIGYRFLRWGGEHAVRIQSRNGRLSLQPSDSLVQQRLSEQWPSGNPQYWILDRDGGERQSPRQAPDECEEEA